MSPKPFQRESYRTQNGVRAPRSPGTGTGKGLGKGFDYVAFAAEHFPDLPPFTVQAATYHVHARNHKRQDPTPEAVAARLDELGWV